MLESLIEALKIIPFVFTALFPLVNPVGTAFVLFSMTGPLNSPAGRSIAMKISVYTFFILAFFFLFGRLILAFFGISIPAVQTGGGIVLALMGWNLLNAPAQSKNDLSSQKMEIQSSLNSDVFYPFTFPLTVGPGCLAVTLTLSAHIKGISPLSITLETIAVLIGLIAICVVTYFCYSRLGLITIRLSAGGIQALSKLLAFVVICIGVEIAWNGIKSLH